MRGRVQSAAERFCYADGRNRFVTKPYLPYDRGGRTCGSDCVLFGVLQGKDESVAMAGSCYWRGGGCSSVCITNNL